MLRIIALSLACVLSFALVKAYSAAARTDLDPVGFETDVRPILDLYCFECHGPNMPEAGLRLDSLSAILKGGDGGPAVVPGESAKSLIYQALKGEEAFRMPPEGDPVPDDEVEVIRAWIDQGANGENSNSQSPKHPQRQQGANAS